RATQAGDAAAGHAVQAAAERAVDHDVESRPVRVVFFGTPQFAVPSLDALAREHEVALVVAQPDKPAGRGMKLQAPAVALRARELGLPLAQPAKIRDAGFLDSVAALRPDVGIVVAYG